MKKYLLIQFTQILKFGLALYLLINYNLLGILYIFLLTNLISSLTCNIFNIYPLGCGDLQFVNANKTYPKNFNAVNILELESLDDIESIKTDIYEKGIKKFPRLRQRVIYFLHDWFFEEVSHKEAEAQIKIINHITLKSTEEIIEFCRKLIDEEFPVGKIPSEFLIIKGNEGKGYVLHKFHHVMTDGVGVSALIHSITSKENKEDENKMIFPKIGLMHRLWAALWSPVFMAYLFFRHLVLLPSVSQHSPFKNKIWSNDSTKASISYNKDHYKPNGSLHQSLSPLMNISFTKKLCFEKTQKFSKSQQITFNDFILGTISMAFNKYVDKYSSKHKNISEFLVCIPINTKDISKNFEGMGLNNEASGVLVRIPVTDTIKDNHSFFSKLKTEIKTNAKDIRMVFGVKWANDISSAYVPGILWQNTVKFILRFIDMHVSNVPGPASGICIGGSKVTNIFGVPVIGYTKFFIGIYTYNKKYTINLIADPSIECDMLKFKDLLEEVIEATIN